MQRRITRGLDFNRIWVFIWANTAAVLSPQLISWLQFHFWLLYSFIFMRIHQQMKAINIKRTHFLVPAPVGNVIISSIWRKQNQTQSTFSSIETRLFEKALIKSCENLTHKQYWRLMPCLTQLSAKHKINVFSWYLSCFSQKINSAIGADYKRKPVSQTAPFASVWLFLFFIESWVGVSFSLKSVFVTACQDNNPALSSQTQIENTFCH